MLSPSAPIFGSLVNATANAMARLERSVKMTLVTEGAERALLDGDGGKHAFASRLSHLSRRKQSDYKNVQSAMTYLQLQESGLQVAGRIMNRLTSIAGQAANPLLSGMERGAFVTEFEELKKSLQDIQINAYEDLSLFEQSSDFSNELNNQSGGVPTGTNYGGSPVKRWTSTKDVGSDRGNLTLRVNSGQNPDRYYVQQGNGDIVFDTGRWETAGRSWNQDFDQFVVELNPGQQTIYRQTWLDTDLDGIEDNLPHHTKNAAGDSSANYQGTSISTNPSTPGETELSVVVESTSWFEVSASFDAILSPDPMGITTSVGEISLLPLSFSTLYEFTVDTAQNASTASGRIIDEIENLTQQHGQVGASMGELENMAARLVHYVSASAESQARMEEGFVEDSMKRAKESIQLESNLALTAQARQINRNLIRALF